MTDLPDDDKGYYTPGTYTMSTKEALEAGFISYDKPSAGDECDHAWQRIPQPAHLCPKCWAIKVQGACTVGPPRYLSPAILEDVEGLIERLECEWTRADGIIKREDCVRAAAVIRALVAEKAKVEEKLEGERKLSADIVGQYERSEASLSAKLERAREGLKQIDLHYYQGEDPQSEPQRIARATLEELK